MHFSLIRTVERTVLGYPFEFHTKLCIDDDEAVRWCRAQFGREKHVDFRDGGRARGYISVDYRDRPARWVQGFSTIWIRDPDDAFEFRMRWC